MKRRVSFIIGIIFLCLCSCGKTSNISQTAANTDAFLNSNITLTPIVDNSNKYNEPNVFSRPEEIPLNDETAVKLKFFFFQLEENLSADKVFKRITKVERDFDNYSLGSEYLYAYLNTMHLQDLKEVLKDVNYSCLSTTEGNGYYVISFSQEEFNYENLMKLVDQSEFKDIIFSNGKWPIILIPSEK